MSNENPQGSASVQRVKRPFLPQEVIRAKRDKQTLPSAIIKRFVKGIGNNTITDAQIAAFTMSVFFRGMTRGECVALTEGMRDSGRVMRWEHLNGPVLDKHSTGGVGDTVSLALAPIIAACGGYVPMISGRGLGHTGGTLDKMASIPGYQIQPDPALFEHIVRSTGCAIIGQTSDLAPVDQRIYAVRDVTATVESVPLITASILSKKLAAGLDGLVMDVKVGNGAFMTTLDAARPLAHSLVAVAQGAKLPIRAVLTDMSQPLAPCAGNACEVQFAVDYLKGVMKAPRFHAVMLALCAHMLVLGKLVESLEEGHRKALAALESGRAAEVFARMVAGLGGPKDFMQRSKSYLNQAHVIRPVLPQQTGQIIGIETRQIGLAVIGLGGGRTRVDDMINPVVGLTHLKQIGEWCDPDTPLAFIHASSDHAYEIASQQVRDAFIVSEHDLRPYDPARDVSNILEIIGDAS